MTLSGRAAALIVSATILFGFLVNAVGHAVLLLRGDPIVRRYRGTLQFVSAWVGDGVILPILNLATANLVAATGRPRAAEVATGAVVGGGLTAAMHVVQATGGHVNWTMPAPWRWNALGWYHLGFMWVQLGWLVMAGRRAIDRRSGATLAILAAGLATFAAILRWDYRTSAD